MSNTPVLNSGNNNMYNEIYCGLFPLDNGYKTCQNCNYGNLSVLKTLTSNGERDCQSNCTTNKACTSYSFNTNSSNNNCTLYNTFPQQTVNNVPNINSGYTLTKFGFNYNNLTDKQKVNVQQKCANQYINNTFTKDSPNVDLTQCLNINTNFNQNTIFKMDSQCVFNAYKNNNLKPKVINSTYNNIGINISNQTDPKIDNQQQYYNQYYDYKNNSYQLSDQLNLGNTFLSQDNNVSDNNNTLYDNYPNTLNNNIMMNDINSNISDILGIKEDFENMNNMNNKNNCLFIILIILLILFIFYVFKKK